MDFLSMGTVVASPVLVLVSHASLGAIPFPVSRNYVACVEAVSPEGLNRFALAEGSITAVSNIWSSWGHDQLPADHIGTRWDEQGAKLFKDLTDQAWHKLWLLEAENLGFEGCRYRLESMFGKPGLQGPTEAVAPDRNKNASEIDGTGRQTGISG